MRLAGAVDYVRVSRGLSGCLVDRGHGSRPNSVGGALGPGEIRDKDVPRGDR